MLIIFLGNATHPHTGYYTLAVETTLIAFGIALVFAPWIASYTESVEEKNPALVATGLALWGWSCASWSGSPSSSSRWSSPA